MPLRGTRTFRLRRRFRTASPFYSPAPSPARRTCTVLGSGFVCFFLLLQLHQYLVDFRVLIVVAAAHSLHDGLQRDLGRSPDLPRPQSDSEVLLRRRLLGRFAHVPAHQLRLLGHLRERPAQRFKARLPRLAQLVDQSLGILVQRGEIRRRVIGKSNSLQLHFCFLPSVHSKWRRGNPPPPFFVFLLAASLPRSAARLAQHLFAPRLGFRLVREVLRAVPRAVARRCDLHLHRLRAEGDVVALRVALQVGHDRLRLGVVPAAERSHAGNLEHLITAHAAVRSGVVRFCGKAVLLAVGRAVNLRLIFQRDVVRFRVQIGAGEFARVFRQRVVRVQFAFRVVNRHVQAHHFAHRDHLGVVVGGDRRRRLRLDRRPEHQFQTHSCHMSFSSLVTVCAVACVRKIPRRQPSPLHLRNFSEPL
nr:MAG TPA: hypothetical protein [Caudoviricetes sp.]